MATAPPIRIESGNFLWDFSLGIFSDGESTFGAASPNAVKDLVCQS